MKKYFIYILFAFQFLPGVVLAQEQKDYILEAMQHELDRSMKELSLPGYDKPFYMMYGLYEQRSYSLSATLGSIIDSKQTISPLRVKSNTRILVGDYSFNDESLEDNLFSNPTAIEIDLPVDTDYSGIRRAYWSTTDKVYRDAARHFKKHQETLKESGKALADIPHRSFAKADPVKIIRTLEPKAINKSEWEERARNLSAIFLNHPTIENSGVYYYQVEGHNYMVTTEGTVVKIPYRYASFTTYAQTKNSKGEVAVEQVTEMSRSLDQLPSEKELAAKINKMISNLENPNEVASLTEDYSGPVLVMGTAVAGVFGQVLFSSRDGSIVASDNIPRLQGIRYNTESAMDNKVGKMILNEAITIKAKPKLKSFEGTDLMGSFEIDNEGIVPADEVTLIENGVLKTLMNNRTITHPTQTANGFASGPGVIEIMIKQKNSVAELKSKLIEKAKAEGLDYAIIIYQSAAPGMGNSKVYKINVSDGKEEPLKEAFLNQVSLKNLKRISGASSKYIAHNLGGGPMFGQQGFGTGGYVSFIMPDAILLDDAEVRAFKMPFFAGEQEYVSNPLKK
jgi:predicted Zn-dependent protease